jgi:hypothetical protein
MVRHQVAVRLLILSSFVPSSVPCSQRSSPHIQESPVGAFECASRISCRCISQVLWLLSPAQLIHDGSPVRIAAQELSPPFEVWELRLLHNALGQPTYEWAVAKLIHDEQHVVTSIA